jgi:ATP-dependent helicase/DNAse subunit B
VRELPALDEHYSPESRAALHHLERSLFESYRDRVNAGAAVRLLEAGGQRAEAELLAAEVSELIAAGLPAEQIAIVYRSPRAVAPLLERVLRQYGVPLASDYELAFEQTTLGRALLALARCAFEADHGSRAADLLAYLRAPGVLDRIELGDALELTVRREGLRTAAQARERFQLGLAEIDSLAGALDPASELARHGRRLLAAPARRTAAVLDRDGELDARALTVMLHALEEVTELGETLSGCELVELLEGLQVQAGYSPPGAVLLTAPLEIRARRFRAILVGGLQDSEFPAGATTEPFFSPELRRELAASSGLALGAGDDGLVRERYLFYSAISRATERVVLSYRSSDEEGNLALPSPFIADVAELLDPGWLERRRRRLLADVLWPHEEAPTDRERARSRAECGDGADGEPVPLTLTETALRRARHREIVSGGALESYAACPVKWLVERELRPEPFGPDPEPVLRGTYMHAALEEILRSLGAPVTPSSLPRALSLLEQVVAERPPLLAPASGHGVRKGLLQGIEADLRRYLNHEAADGCDWQPAEVELRFGFDDDEASLPALELGDGVRVRGAIDRVDVDPAGREAIVRDYKSGAFRPGYQVARWAQDQQLQVALYMLAVRELMGLEPVAGLYQPLRGPDLRARGVFLEGASAGSCLVGNDGRDQEALRAELEQASAIAVELAERLRSGELVPSPPTCSRDGCAFPGICRSR